MRTAREAFVEGQEALTFALSTPADDTSREIASALTAIACFLEAMVGPTVGVHTTVRDGS